MEPIECRYGWRFLSPAPCIYCWRKHRTNQIKNKQMKLISKIFFSLLIAATFLGCKKEFLDRPPLSQISADNFYQTTSDLRLATAALYGGKPWGEWNYNCYLPVGDVLSGNMAVGYWGDAVQLNTFAI